eukprot:14432048-Ditylum_brightwellii.AAC.2
MHKNVTFVHTTNLEKAKYQLKTVLGVSEGYYSNCKTFPIYGSGQGATNFPQTWLEQSAHGAKFISPDQDVNTFCNNKVTVQELLENMQQDSQLWALLLWLTGSLLEL